MEEYPDRYPELDGCRGLAVLLMILYHYFVDLSFFSLPGPDPFSGPLKIFGMCIAIMFIGIAGISAHIKATKTAGFRRQAEVFLKRGGRLILIGFGITVATWWFLKGEGYVVFGILHLIGFGLLLTPVLHRFFILNLIMAIILLFIPYYVEIPHGPIWMAWAGLYPEGFSSVDYTPVIPWIAPFLIGMCIGKVVYPAGKKRYNAKMSDNYRSTFLTTVGQHSLLLYLVHQPFIILILMMITNTYI